MKIVEHIVREGVECASLLTKEVRLVVTGFNRFYSVMPSMCCSA